MQITRRDVDRFAVITDTVLSSGEYHADSCMYLDGTQLRPVTRRGYIRTQPPLRVTLGPIALRAVRALNIGETYSAPPVAPTTPPAGDVAPPIETRADMVTNATSIHSSACTDAPSADATLPAGEAVNPSHAGPWGLHARPVSAPLARLQHHVSGAIARGEREPVIEQPASNGAPMVAPFLAPFDARELAVIGATLTAYARQLQTANNAGGRLYFTGVPSQDAQAQAQRNIEAQVDQLFQLAQRAETAARWTK